MQIVGMYSSSEGKEVITKIHSSELEEILQVIEGISANHCRITIKDELIKASKTMYSSSVLYEAFSKHFSVKGWSSAKVQVEYPQKYYVLGYTRGNYKDNQTASFRVLDFVKNKPGVGLQFGPYQDMVYDVNAKMTIFAKLGVIDCGVEIVPVKALADEMSTGVSYFEQFVWDLEHRGVSDIDIPVLILGIDTDGVKPKDLKLAESKQQYLLFE